MAGQQAGTAVTAIRGGAVTVAEAADAFLSSPRAASPNTRRAYAGVLDRLAAELGPGRQLAAVPGGEIAAALRRLWDGCAPATWNRNRAAIVSWLTWCAAKKRWPAPQLPPDAERRRENNDATRALPRGRVERLLSRRDVPLREKTLWRMLYETAARASEILALNIEDLDLEQRRATIQSKAATPSSSTGTPVPRTCCPDCCACQTAPHAPAGRCSWPAASQCPRSGPPPVTSARTPAGGAWATTAPGSCSRSTPSPPPAAVWNSISFVTPPRPTSVTRRSRCS
jgi:hypothetical protein